MDEITKSLGLAPLDKQEIIIAKPPVPTDAEKDFNYARQNFYNVIEKGTEALEDMLQVARSSEHPRAYEVVSTIMKTLVDANKDLVAMGEKKAKAQQPEENGKNVTNNNLFVGSTAELQKMLRDLRDDEPGE